jgi:hypothetical protein
MSNKTQLQANNSALDGYISRINAAKDTALSLPEAGGASEVTLQSKTVTPTKSVQEITADTGYAALDKVTVEAIPDNYIITTDATATSEDMLKGETAYVDGTKITGSIADFDGSYECSGESTGGVNIETCTVTVENRLTIGSANTEYLSLFVYTDGSLNTVLFNLTVRNDAGWGIEPIIHTFTVAKGTVIFVPHGFNRDSDEDVVYITDSSGYTAACVVNGDCTISIG